jgi:type I pantothenate kinase
VFTAGTLFGRADFDRVAADDHHFRDLALDIAARVQARRPILVGITGGVAVGKSTTAATLARRLARTGLRVDVLSTDAFLLPNAELERRGLAMRKGFPETFAIDDLDACLLHLRAGREVEVPVYSHVTYDRVPAATVGITPGDVVIVEGVNVLQPPAVDRLDVGIYVDADEGDMRDWFVERFLSLCASADEGSFYAPLRGLSEDEQRALAAAAWDGINAVNLREHTRPSRRRATHVVHKARDHSIRSCNVGGSHRA